MESMEVVHLAFNRLRDTADAPMTSLPRKQTRELTGYRSRFVWSLLSISLTLYFALLMLVLYFPALMTRSIAGAVSFGLIVVALQLLLTIVMFGVYFWWTVSRYDSRTGR
jgi:uncharacterized membrane protein (DUF485 family)